MHGRAWMRHGGPQRIYNLFVAKYPRSEIVLLQLSGWIQHNSRRSKRTGKSRNNAPLTENDKKLLYELRREFPKITWEEFTMKFNEKCSHLEHLTWIQLANAFHRYVPNQKRGYWSPEEETMFMEQYGKFGYSISRYKIPNRSTDSLRGKVETFFQSSMSKLKGKSFSAMIMESFRKLTEDGCFVSQDALLAEILQSNTNISAAFLAYFFKTKFYQLVRCGRIEETNNGKYVVPTKPAVIPLPALKRKKRKQPPLRDRPLDDEELDHVKSLMDECKNLQETTDFQWFNDKKHMFSITFTVFCILPFIVWYTYWTYCNAFKLNALLVSFVYLARKESAINSSARHN